MHWIVPSETDTANREVRAPKRELPLPRLLSGQIELVSTSADNVTEILEA